MKTTRYVVSATVALVLLFGATALAAENPAFMKFHTKGDYAAVLANVKQSLEAAQFQITGEEALSKGLENNKAAFPEGQWNSIGFENVTAVHFCSMVFNQQVFNMNLDWSILCPFKLSMYNTKKAPQDITVIVQRPTYLLAKDPHAKAKEIGKTMEDRIVSAIKEGLSH